MTEEAVPSLTIGRTEQIFPVLTNGQIERIARYGDTRVVEQGEVLQDTGDRSQRFYVLTSGRLEIVRPSGERDELVAIHRPGQFSGEVSTLSGRPSLVQIRVAEPGTVIQLEHDRLMELVQVDSELGEILMRAFLMRRVEIIAHGFGDALLIGSNHSPGTLRIKEFLTRNNHPFSYLDLDRDSEVQTVLDQFQIALEDVPVVICRGTSVLRNPTNKRIADCLGFNEVLDEALVRDVVVIGAGPAGLAAAVYAASEGLDVVVLESGSPGGQAGSSSRIENYLGFPAGISGNDLAGRAYAQAQKFGAHIMIARGAKKLSCERKPYAVLTEDGGRVAARTVVIATGAEYRRIPLENLSRFEGAGVYYGATFVESQFCGGEDVVVIGGGNSAGQAAVFLSQHANHVELLVRSDGLADTMSRYLVRRIEESPNITLRSRTEVVSLDGGDHLEEVRWRDNVSGDEDRRAIRHLFLMTGAVPGTSWLEECLALDEKGFIATGPDLSRDQLDTAGWLLPRNPYLLETSLPGVFAVGDVRGGSVKRVASAVGEGSIVISFVHRVLAEGS